MRYADLHIHTKFSDGTFDPARVIDLAKKIGLSCISITDHDSVEAYKHLPRQNEIEIIPGIELSADIDNTEAHFLGYGIDCQSRWLQDKLESLRDGRVERMKEMCVKLSALGMTVSMEEVLKLSGHCCVGRLHLARLLKGKNFVGSIQDAFNRYIGDSGVAYVSRLRLTASEAIGLIRRAKGVAVLAHPYSLNGQGLINEFIGYGLQGIEAVYPEHSASQVEFYKQTAKENGLCVSGGSDCHGEAKPHIKIGTVKLEYSFVEEIKRKIADG